MRRGVVERDAGARGRRAERLGPEDVEARRLELIGQREAESGSLALRVRGAGKKQELLTIEAFLARVVDEVRSRALAAPRLPRRSWNPERNAPTMVGNARTSAMMPAEATAPAPM